MCVAGAISRARQLACYWQGLSQGKLAALVSGLASGCGILFHVMSATFGLTLLIQTSELVFTL
ncbi:hypothetical protein JCM19240_1257 [Vibrio maritimus]|uniref:Uncharacterized protein n=1 Tax=Vibrio maritimus TaxID=990268 RepID=A0A090T6F2_9VIBR|nr:hypothetical protein JCM19240_1257 [Vibrio maritimus]